ncbi:MAG: hypothetical protein JXA49_02460, partial [Actinobacteria bacterium]|nr:hypothetical protein [Actinomycetota bacterium]
MKIPTALRTTASFLAIVIIVCACGVATTCRQKGSGVSAELTVHERSGVDRTSEPVTSGVPLSRSANIKSVDALRLVDSSGNNVPAQFAVTSRWGGAPGDGSLPIRWLLVDFASSVSAGGSAAYYLQSGGSGSATGTNLRVTRNDAEYLDITTGAGVFSFNKNSFNIFNSVTVGPARLIAPGNSSQIRAVAPGGEEFISTAAPANISIECDGPIRKTVKVTGSLGNGSGKLLDYTARISLFNDSADARLSISIANKRDPQVDEGQPECWDIGCPRSAEFRDLTLRIESEAAGGGTLKLGGNEVQEFQVGAGSLEIYQDSSGAPNWNRHQGNHPRPSSYVSFRGYRTYVNGSQAASGNQPDPWIQSSGTGGGLAATVRDFWQNYPKALRGTGNTVEVSLFPDEYTGNYSFRPQEQKTHEVLLSFFNPGSGAAQATRKCLAFQDPLFAEASAAYYLSTRATGRVTGISGDAEFASYEELARSALNGTSPDGEPRNLYQAIDDASFYSWQDYGELPIDYENGGTAQFNDKYNFGLGMMLQYLRSGDFRWFRLAEAEGKHVSDLDVLHYQGEIDIWWKGGFFGHGYHDEDGNSNPNRNYGAPHPDLSFATPALLQLYYLTGNPVAFDSAVEVAENTKYRFNNSFGRGNGEGYAESYDYDNECDCCRPFAHGLWIFVDAYRATGDESYLQSARWLIQDSRRSTDMFITEPVPGDRRFKKLFTWDLLEFALGRYLDLCAEMGREDTSGARDLLLAMTRQEAERMWQSDGNGNKGVPYAWMRDGTPWGWEDTIVPVNVCSWQLLTADALTYGYLYGGDPSLLDRAREAFKTGSNPNTENYRPQYVDMKEATNNANFGLVYMHYRNPPGDVPGSAQFNEWICLENPGDTPAEVTLNYYMGDGENLTEKLSVAPRSRSTVDVNSAVGWGKDVSATVTSSQPVVAERPMYFNYHYTWPGGHDEVGSKEESATWYFAEGCTREGFEQWMT